MASSLLRTVTRRAAAGASLVGCGARISVSGDPIFRPYSTSPSRSSPWLMLPPALEGSDMFYKFYSLADNEIITISKRSGANGEEEEELPDDDAEFVGSSHGWLALHNPRNNNLFLSNPLSRRHLKLPPLHTLKNGNTGVSKVIISGSPDEEDCRAMISYGEKKRLAFCCPGRSTAWTPIGDEYHEFTDVGPYVYERFVYSNTQKLFFCITIHYDLEAWDLRDPKSPQMNPLDWDCDEEAKAYPWGSWSKEETLAIRELCTCSKFKFLVTVDHTNDLFLVTRHVLDGVHLDGSPVGLDDMLKDWDWEGNSDPVLFENFFPHKTIGFDVHKYDPDEQTLKYMDSSLGGLALFIGSNHGFALSTTEFSELKPNSIYFTDTQPMIQSTDHPSRRLHGGHDLGIYDYESRTFSPCHYPFDIQSIKRIMPAPMWFTPNQH